MRLLLCLLLTGCGTLVGVESSALTAQPDPACLPADLAASVDVTVTKASPSATSMGLYHSSMGIWSQVQVLSAVTPHTYTFRGVKGAYAVGSGCRFYDAVGWADNNGLPPDTLSVPTATPPTSTEPWTGGTRGITTLNAAVRMIW